MIGSVSFGTFINVGVFNSFEGGGEFFSKRLFSCQRSMNKEVLNDGLKYFNFHREMKGAQINADSDP